MEKQDIGIIDFVDGLPLQSGILKVPEDLDILAGWLSKREHRIRIDEQDFPIVRYKEKLSLIHVTSSPKKMKQGVMLLIVNSVVFQFLFGIIVAISHYTYQHHPI